MRITTVRLPAELYAWLQEQARAEKRSWNSQVLYLLEQAQRSREQQERPRPA